MDNGYGQKISTPNFGLLQGGCLEKGDGLLAMGYVWVMGQALREKNCQGLF